MSEARLLVSACTCIYPPPAHMVHDVPYNTCEMRGFVFDSFFIYSRRRTCVYVFRQQDRWDRYFGLFLRHTTIREPRCRQKNSSREHVFPIKITGQPRPKRPPTSPGGARFDRKLGPTCACAHTALEKSPSRAAPTAHLTAPDGCAAIGCFALPWAMDAHTYGGRLISPRARAAGTPLGSPQAPPAVHGTERVSHGRRWLPFSLKDAHRLLE